MAEEVALAQRHGVQVVTLGTRILRAETAAIATVANVMYEFERQSNAMLLPLPLDAPQRMQAPFPMNSVLPIHYNFCLYH